MKRIFLSAATVVTVLIVGTATAAADPGTTRYVAPSGTDVANNCATKSNPCQHIQYAVSQASAGDKVQLAAGTYSEQVTITKSLTLVGAGVDKSVIKAPATLPPTQSSDIVQVSGSTVNVAMSQLTVSGPGTGPCGTIGAGIAVFGGATLDIDHASVLDIRDNPLSGCQNGEGIRVGTQPFGAPDTGHLIADHLLVARYQKNGITVDGTGSTGDINHNTVQSTPTNQIASNGIQVSDGAVAQVDHNTVTGNECNLVGTCGPDWFSQFQSIGILLSSAGAGTTVSNNDVHANDIGIDAGSGGEIDHNDVSNNRDFGLVLESGYASEVDHNSADGANASCPSGTTSCDGILVFASGATFDHNNADQNGNNGIEVGPLTPTAVNNTFDHNSMKGNVQFDANDHTAGMGTAGTGNTWTHDNCATTSPAGLCK